MQYNAIMQNYQFEDVHSIYNNKKVKQNKHKIYKFNYLGGKDIS